MKQSAARDRAVLELKRSVVPFVLYVLLVAGGLFTAADIISHLTGTKPWETYTSYKAAFSDVKGVQPGTTSLRIAGVEVGDVSAWKDTGGHVVMTLNIEKKYAPLYRNARVEVRPVTPLEDMYVDIVSRGTPSAGVLGPNEILPMSHTNSPVEIGDVLDVFDGNTRAYLTTLLDQLGKGLSGNGGQQLRASFEEIAPFLSVANRMTTAMARERTDLASLVHTFGGISGELDLRDRQLQQFVNYGNTTLKSLADSSGPLAATIQRLPGTLSTMSSAFSTLRNAEGSLDPALSSLKPVAAALPSGLNALSSFSVAATPALHALLPSAKALKPLAQQLQPTSKDLANAFTRLQPEAPQINRVTQLAADGNCLTYIGQFLNQVISMTKFGDGVDNIANARADVETDFGNVSKMLRPTSWKMAPICYKVAPGSPTA